MLDLFWGLCNSDLSTHLLWGLLWNLGLKHSNPLERFWVCFCQALRNISIQLWSSWTRQVQCLNPGLPVGRLWDQAGDFIPTLSTPRQRLFLISGLVFSLRNKHLKDPIWFWMWQSWVHPMACWGQGLIFYPTAAIKRQDSWKIRLAKPLESPAGSGHTRNTLVCFLHPDPWSVFLVSGKLSKAFKRICCLPANILRYSVVKGFLSCPIDYILGTRVLSGFRL